MSHLIPLISMKSDRAIRFGKELDRAMRTRGVGRRAVAKAVGGSASSVMNWRTGRMLPRIATVEKLADALSWPRLVSLAASLRRKACLVCGADFIDDSGSDNRRYCGLSCRSVAGKRIAGVDRRQRAATAERRLIAHRRAVAAYCGGCEPAGRCLTPACALRPVSPLPLSEDSDVVALRPSPRNGYRETGAQSALMLSVWARYTPAERADRISRAAAANRIARGLIP